MEDKYYSFDINNYKVPNATNSDDDDTSPKLVYELNEYSQSEFTEKYLDYKSFDWYGH